MSAQEPKIEDTSDDDMPELEPAPGAEGVPEAEAGDVSADGKKSSRAENKARKAFQKLGLKSVPGVTRVVVKRGRGIFFVVHSPDVMKSATNDNTYVFFGEPKQEDASAALQQQAAAMQFAQQHAGKGSVADDDDVPELVDAAKPAAPAVSGSVDESGVNPKHIELVLEQVPSASRAQAVTALKKTNGDIVNAIMELTMGS
jgi:nascent polypeptide-associated complex subunit alpha